MNKIFFKFSLALVLLINTVIFVLFFPDLIVLLEDYLYPLFFIYFIIDSFSVILPMYNNSIYSGKMQRRNYIEITGFDKENIRSP